MANKKYPYYNVPEPSDLKEMIENSAKDYGKKTAFWYRKNGKEIRVSFEKLKDDIDAFGTYLYSKGYVNTHIAVIGENSYEWIVSYFAIVNGGNVVVPIDKEATVEDVKFQLAQSDTVLLLCSNAYVDVAKSCDVEYVSFKEFDLLFEEGKKLINNGHNEFSNVKIDRERLCAIVFTSGTTSKPKGVMLTHKNLITDAVITLRNTCIPNDTISLLPFYHTFGFMVCVIGQILMGYKVYINSSLKRAFDDINYAKPKFIATVPMLLIAIYEKIWASVRAQKKENLLRIMIFISNIFLKFGIDLRRVIFKKIFEALGGNLEMMITGGSSIDEKYINGFRDIGIFVSNGYGITECSPIVSCMRNKHYAPKSVGSVNSELECRFVNGELQIKGPIVFMGYYKNDVATDEAFDGEWFKTGDLGSIDEDGLLYITGRKKNLIILSNGKNVVPEELESLLLNNISEIKETLVYGENDVIVAEIYPNDEIENVESIIKEKIKEINIQLPSFKQIASTKFRETEFPKTTTKKIKRKYGDE